MKVIETKEYVVDISEIPDDFHLTYLRGFISLMETGMNCETSLLIFLLKEHKRTPTVMNDEYFRDQFRSFCDQHNATPFADATIKKGLRALRDLNLVEQPEHGKYRLHSKFFYVS